MSRKKPITETRIYVLGVNGEPEFYFTGEDEIVGPEQQASDYHDEFPNVPMVEITLTETARTPYVVEAVVPARVAQDVAASDQRDSPTGAGLHVGSGGRMVRRLLCAVFGLHCWHEHGARMDYQGNPLEEGAIYGACSERTCCHCGRHERREQKRLPGHGDHVAVEGVVGEWEAR